MKIINKQCEWVFTKQDEIIGAGKYRVRCKNNVESKFLIHTEKGYMPRGKYCSICKKLSRKNTVRKFIQKIRNRKKEKLKDK